jgi:hypothetical protein
VAQANVAAAAAAQASRERSRIALHGTPGISAAGAAR